jgi:hypothetical protein
MFTVTNTVQSTTTNDAGEYANDPVDMVWYKGDSLVAAVSAVAQVASHHDSDPAWVVTRSVRIDFS